MTFRCPTVWSTELCASVPRTVLVLLMKQRRLLDSDPSQTPFELRSFLPYKALFIPNRGIAIHLSLGPRPIIFFSVVSFLTPPCGTERYYSLGPRPISRSLSLLFFLTPPCDTEQHRSLGPRPILSFLTPTRGTERYCSLGPRPILFFFNTTPLHRATLLSRSAIARVASVSVRFRRKERLNGASKERKGGTPWHRATPLLDRDRCFFCFFLMPPRGTATPLF